MRVRIKVPMPRAFALSLPPPLANVLACRLFSRIDDGLSNVARIFREHFQDLGSDIVKEREAAAGE